MRGRRFTKELPPGTYTHDASVVAHLGKIYLPAAAVIGSVVEAAHLIGDALHDDGIKDEFVAIGQWALLGTVAFAGFGALQHHYERRTEQIRSEHVTD
jgi:hypothetical protein